MPPAQVPSLLSNAIASLKSWTHAIAPAGSNTFDALAWASLGFYLLFAVIAMHYAFKPWAENAMLASITAGGTASLMLHLSLLNSPTYIGEGALWKFISVSQFLPWAIATVGCGYLLYRIYSKAFAKQQ